MHPMHENDTEQVPHGKTFIYKDTVCHYDERGRIPTRKIITKNQAFLERGDMIVANVLFKRRQTGSRLWHRFEARLDSTGDIQKSIQPVS